MDVDDDTVIFHKVCSVCLSRKKNVSARSDGLSRGGRAIRKRMEDREKEVRADKQEQATKV